MICEGCKYIECPPSGYLQVIGSIMHGSIISSKTGKIDSLKSIMNLARCGWFIREASINLKTNDIIVKIEYCGNLRCPRVSSDYRHFPIRFKTCRNKMCLEGGVLV